MPVSYTFPGEVYCMALSFLIFCFCFPTSNPTSACMGTFNQGPQSFAELTIMETLCLVTKVSP